MDNVLELAAPKARRQFAESDIAHCVVTHEPSYSSWPGIDSKSLYLEAREMVLHAMPNRSRSWVVQESETSLPQQMSKTLLVTGNVVRKSSGLAVAIPRKLRSPKTGRPESFVLRAQRLDQRGLTDTALDLIYDSVDELMLAGKFSQLDAILAELPVEQLSVDMLLGMLTSTLPARSRLPSRSKVFAETERVLRERGEYEDGLLTGLEG